MYATGREDAFFVTAAYRPRPTVKSVCVVSRFMMSCVQCTTSSAAAAAIIGLLCVSWKTTFVEARGGGGVVDLGEINTSLQPTSSHSK